MGLDSNNMEEYKVQKMLYSFLVTLCCELIFVSAQSTEPRITYSLLEEQPSNTYIGNIPQDVELTQQYPQETVNSFNFGILLGRYKDFFTMEVSTGILKTSAILLDREALCAFKSSCVLSLDIGVVKPIEYFQVITIAINLEDKNDNPPRFPKPKLQLNISENASPGSEFVVPTAVDLDTEENGVQGYDFISNTSKFELKVTKNADDTTGLRLMLKDRLDREVVSAYSLKVIATDGGDQQQMGEIEIRVNVLDSNDNSPIFDKDIYNVTIEENYPLHRSFVQVHAYDLDSGPNGQVIYSLSTQSLAQYGNILAVNRTTGHVTLTSALDYEQESSYTLLIEASDQGPDSLPAHAKIVLRLLDVNDHAPRITVNALTESGHAQISEWANVGTFVAHVLVEDLDRGPSGQVTCEMMEEAGEGNEGVGQHLALEPIYTGTGPQQQHTGQYKLITAAKLDYEKRHTYSARLLCRDGGMPEPLQATRTVTVAVVDENDHAPIFHESVYHKQLRENGTAGAVLLQLAASDADHGDNALVRYRLDTTDGQADAKVAVDEDTGQVHTKTVFDHEQMDSFVFHVIAYDGGNPSLSATATVSIDIIDINDEAPRFEKESYDFATAENQGIDTEIGIIMASDPDSPPFNEFTMYLHPDSSALDTFSLDPRQGILRTKKVLDREHQATYSLIVVAANTAFPRLSSSVPVTVHVTDVNDNAPSIAFPAPHNDSVTVSAQAPENYVFSRVLASDADMGKNAKLVYEIVKGNDEHLFAMDPSTGALSISVNLQESTRNEVTLVIMVKDDGSPHKSAVASLDVKIDRVSAFLPAANGKGGIILGYHQKIIIILGCVTAFLVVVLLTAIVILKCRQRSASTASAADKPSYKYACRIDLAHRLCNSDDAASDAADSTTSDASIKPPKKSVSFDDNQEQRGDQGLYVANSGPNKSHLTLEVGCIFVMRV